MGLLASGLAVIVPVTSSVGATPAGNLARAQLEAPRLLRLLQLPPGASASSTEPNGDRGVLAQPGYDEATPNLVDAHAWWTVSGQAAAVLRYVAAHVPSNAKRSGLGSGNVAPGYASETFSLPPIAGVLSERVLAVTVVQLNRNRTGVRTDGEAVWILPRPAWERIPTSVRRVIVTARGPTASGQPGAWSVPRVITGARARRLVAFINRLGVVQPGVYACPLEVAKYVRLRFVGGHGQTVARALEQPTGCASVSLTIRGRRGLALNDYPSVTEALERIGAIPVCSASQLQASVGPPTYYPSGRVITFNFRNRSDSLCLLSGYPRLLLFDARGRALPTAVTDAGGAPVLNPGAVLDPRGATSFTGNWTTCAAPRAGYVTVRLPGVSGLFTLSTGSARRPFAPCDGRLRVSLLTPTL